MSRPLPESDLVERARAGDAQAYEALVREHQGIAFRTAYLITGSAADAEESAQDGFVKAYRALGRFRTGRAVSSLGAGDRRERGPQPQAFGRSPNGVGRARGRRGSLGGRGSVPRG